MSENIMNTYTACETSIVLMPYPVFKIGNVCDHKHKKANTVKSATKKPGFYEPVKLQFAKV